MFCFSSSSFLFSDQKFSFKNSTAEGKKERSVERFGVESKGVNKKKKEREKLRRLEHTPEHTTVYPHTSSSRNSHRDRPAHQFASFVLAQPPEMLRRKWAVGSVCVFTRDGDATETTDRPCFIKDAMLEEQQEQHRFGILTTNNAHHRRKEKKKKLWGGGACRNTFSNPEVHSLTHHPTSSSFRYLNDIALKLMIYQKTTDAA